MCLDDPFRPALVSSIGSCHHVLYPRESCQVCADPYNTAKLTPVDPEKFLADLHKVMGPGQAKRAIMLYTHFAKNLPTLTRQLYSDWIFLFKLDHISAPIMERHDQASNTPIGPPLMQGISTGDRRGIKCNTCLLYTSPSPRDS